MPYHLRSRGVSGTGMERGSFGLLGGRVGSGEEGVEGVSLSFGVLDKDGRWLGRVAYVRDEVMGVAMLRGNERVEVRVSLTSSFVGGGGAARVGVISRLA